MLQNTNPLTSLGELFGNYLISLSRTEQKITFYFGKHKYLRAL